MYQVRRPSRSEFVPVRHLRYHVRQWGQPTPGVAPLVMVHGWMDVGASYQFVVDAMARDRWVIAPDWRGYGLTGFDTHAPGGPGYLPATDHYTFADYLADLDGLLDHYAPDQPVDLVGHSMGGNIVMLYAGVRPGRIRRLVNLEGFGMPATRPAQAAGRYAKWLDEIKAIHTGAMALKTYDSVAGVASRLMKTNPRLGQDKADWLAPHWAAQGPDGRWAILGDAAHKVVNPQLYRVDEVLDLYSRITAPTLAVESSDNELEHWWKGKYTLAEYHERIKMVPNLRQALVTDAGHMLHHDQPDQLAALLEDFTA
jgi:pimeloyl-ACP methyl ester carboxylesterase